MTGTTTVTAIGIGHTGSTIAGRATGTTHSACTGIATGTPNGARTTVTTIAGTTAMTGSTAITCEAIPAITTGTTIAAIGSALTRVFCTGCPLATRTTVTACPPVSSPIDAVRTHGTRRTSNPCCAFITDGTCDTCRTGNAPGTPTKRARIYNGKAARTTLGHGRTTHAAAPTIATHTAHTARTTNATNTTGPAYSAGSAVSTRTTVSAEAAGPAVKAEAARTTGAPITAMGIAAIATITAITTIAAIATVAARTADAAIPGSTTRTTGTSQHGTRVVKSGRTRRDVAIGVASGTTIPTIDSTFSVLTDRSHGTGRADRALASRHAMVAFTTGFTVNPAGAASAHQGIDTALPNSPIRRIAISTITTVVTITAGIACSADSASRTVNPHSTVTTSIRGDICGGVGVMAGAGR